MQETLLQVADAVLAGIQFGLTTNAFSQAFTAAVAFDTELKLEDAQALPLVSIVPGRVKTVLQDRNGREGDYTVDVAVRRAVAPGDAAAMRSLFSLQRELDDFLFHLGEENGHRLPGFVQAVWTASDLKWPFVPEALRHLNQFTGINWVTYHVLDLDE